MVSDLLALLEGWAPVAALRSSIWLYPVVNVVHVLGIALLYGAIAAFDLRVIGFARGLPTGLLAAHLLRLVWVGFGLAALSGLALFATDATALAANGVFLWKLGMIAAAGCNAFLLHFVLGRRTYSGSRAIWSGDPPAPAVKLAGLASLTLWTGVIVLGRWIAYW